MPAAFLFRSATMRPSARGDCVALVRCGPLRLYHRLYLYVAAVAFAATALLSVLGVSFACVPPCWASGCPQGRASARICRGGLHIQGWHGRMVEEFVDGSGVTTLLIHKCSRTDLRRTSCCIPAIYVADHMCAFCLFLDDTLHISG